MRYCFAIMIGIVFVWSNGLYGQEPSKNEVKSRPIDFENILDDQHWKISNATAEAAEADGRKTVRLTSKGDSADGVVGLAVPIGVEFQYGSIEVELKGKNVRQQSFLGVAFNVVDERHFEAIYFRPFNFKADDVFKGRAVQYLAWPENTWDKLRKEFPGKFEAPVKPVPNPDDWFRARIEVTPKQVHVFVEGSSEPSLTVDRLTTGEEPRPIGLFVDVADGLYSNLRVTPKNH
ncbi:MAG: hypothetical protein KGQ60_00070 [Planctomycetes bacterium]|nr:hypothetical protein [Planctomycetota bacterium]